MGTSSFLALLFGHAFPISILNQNQCVSGAYSILTALLERIEALSLGKSPGPGSYAHAQTLGRLARCLKENGRPREAEEQTRNALVLIEKLIAQQPDNQTYVRQRGVFLTDLGSILREQGLDAQAQAAIEEAQHIAVEQGDLRQQAVVLAELGTVMLSQKRLQEAQTYYRKALEVDVTLAELPLTEDMDPQNALVILQILETLESSADLQILGE